MDADVSALVSAVPAGHPRADELFLAVRTAWEAEPTDLDAFLDRLRQDAGHLLEHDDLDVLRAQLDHLGGDPMEHLRRLAEHDPVDLAAHHAELSAPAAGDGPLDWVRAEQADRVQQVWGQDWPAALPEHLAHHWGADWESHPAEHKAEWLDALIPDLLAAQPADADPFGWVPEEQGERLRVAWGEDWQRYLAEQLDHRWGADWQAHPADHKAAWLPDLVDDLLAPAGDIPTQPGDAAQPAAEDIAEFSAAEVDEAISAAIAAVPGADSLSEEDLDAVRRAIAEELAAEGSPAQ